MFTGRILFLVELSINLLFDFLKKWFVSLEPLLGAEPSSLVTEISSRKLLLSPACVIGVNVLMFLLKSLFGIYSDDEVDKIAPNTRRFFNKLVYIQINYRIKRKNLI